MDSLPIEQRIRLNVEWAVTSALREMIGISGALQEPTYRNSIALGERIAPKLFDPDVRILKNPGATKDARTYRQIADGQTHALGYHVDPVSLVDAEIAALKLCLAGNDEAHLVRSKLEHLEIVRLELLPKRTTETPMIMGDYIKTDVELPVTEWGIGCIEFELPDRRALRVRVLHPDKPEHKTGADLLYEHIDLDGRKARIALIQYKIWDGKSFHFDRKVGKQLDKMKKFACDNRFCAEHLSAEETYRMPNCTAFLRPTDELQDPNSTPESSGLHIPICVVAKAWEPNQNGGESIRRGSIEHRSLTHKTFKELFRNRMVGSRELSFEELKRVYKDNELFQDDRSVIIHAQEFKQPKKTRSQDGEEVKAVDPKSKPRKTTTKKKPPPDRASGG